MIRQTLQERFQLSEFRPGQEPVIEALMRGESALAIFPTGGGKSLCYQLPALLLPGVTIVVSPLLALMRDQIDALARRGVRAARLDSTMSMPEVRAVQDELRAGKLKLLYVAPERFNNERFVAQLHDTRVSLFAVDEAHCVSEWGHNFRPDYLKLAGIAREIGAERVLALTATATEKVAADVCASFAIKHVTRTGSYRPNLNLNLLPCTEAERDRYLVARLVDGPHQPAIVYVTLQATAERVAMMLSERGRQAEAYHAGLEDDVRDRIQNGWMNDPSGVVVATIAFGMGIDRADVRQVIHYNLPKSLESYSQEIGRAGRDGQPSLCEMYACASDITVLENFAYGDTPTPASIRSLIEALYAETDSFLVNMLALSNTHDIRMNVLRTALTYMELGGVLRQGTPIYTTAKVKPFGNDLGPLMDAGKAGRLWTTFDIAEAAEKTGIPRQKIMETFDEWKDQGLAEVQLSDVRYRFEVTKKDPDIIEALVRRFEHREAQEIARTQQLIALVTASTCQSRILGAHFGETDETPCGHCTTCARKGGAALPNATRAAPIIPADLPEELTEPRERARFLCGLPSPKLTRAKLTKHAQFGSLAHCGFADVLAAVARRR